MRIPPFAPRALGPGPRGVLGFTLLELMVVIVLMGIIASMAVIAFPTERDWDRLAKQAERFHALLGIAEEEAVVRGQSIGLGVYAGGYRFYVLDRRVEPPAWEPFEGDRWLTARELPEALAPRLILEGTEVVLKEPDELERPQIFILPSGEILPSFELLLGGPALNGDFVISLGPMGRPELERPPRPR